MSSLKINDAVTVGGQLTQPALEELAQKGFRSVVNFRAADEEEGQWHPDDEGEAVRVQGMTYRHIPVSMNAMDPAAVDEFRSRFAQLPKPVYAHCKSGTRAGAMVMMDLACRQGLSGEETLAKAEELGFKCDKPELRQFVSQYVDQHQPSTS